MRQPREMMTAGSAVRRPSIARVSGRQGASFAIRRAPPSIDSAAIAASSRNITRAAFATGEKATKSGLRFVQFLRAYIHAFVAGAASVMLFSELASGHFNPVMMIATHIYLFIVGPIFALMMSPTIFAFYRLLAISTLSSGLRGYIVGMAPGVLLLVSRVATGTSLIDGKTHADFAAIGMLISGAIAGYTFNRAIERIERHEASSG